MVAMKEIEGFGFEIGRRFRPRRVVLFGSYAGGGAEADSDVDLLVEMEHEGSGCRAAAEIIRTLKPRFAVDLIVRTEEEVKNRLRQNDSFLRDIVQNGRVIYESTDHGVGR